MKYQQKIIASRRMCCNHQNHQQFYNLIANIRMKRKISECFQIMDKLYRLKQYHFMDQTIQQIVQRYESLCLRIYSNNNQLHIDGWANYQLKIFLWLIVCDLFHEIKEPHKIHKQKWQNYSQIFHGKSVELMQYQVKSIISFNNQNKKWDSQQDNLLIQIIKSFQKNLQWTEIAKRFYIKSEKRFYRSPKQIREHYINHFDPFKIKSQWTLEQDIYLLLNVQKYGKKWSKIAKLGNNKRTDHMIKNRYHALIKHKQRTCCSIRNQGKCKQLMNKIRQLKNMKQCKSYIKRENLTEYMCLDMKQFGNIEEFSLKNQYLKIQQQQKLKIVTMPRQKLKQSQFFQFEFQSWLGNIKQLLSGPELKYIESEAQINENNNLIQDFSQLQKQNQS